MGKIEYLEVEKYYGKYIGGGNSYYGLDDIGNDGWQFVRCSGNKLVFMRQNTGGYNYQKYEYILVEEHCGRYIGGGNSYYGLDDLGDDGWQLMGNLEGKMLFMRPFEDPYSSTSSCDSYDDDDYSFSTSSRDFREESHEYDDSDYEFSYEEESDPLDRVYDVLRLMADELSQVQQRETILLAMVQDLLEKLYPDSTALAAFKQMLKDGESANEYSSSDSENPATQDDGGESSATDEISSKENEITGLVKGFAYERVERALGEEDEDAKIMSLYIALAGFSGFLPWQTKEDHYRYMLRALYEYYNNNPDDKITECYTEALRYLAISMCSQPDLEALNAAADTNFSISDGVDTFFTIIAMELEFEKSGDSPFKIAKIGEFIGIFISIFKKDSDLYENEELLTKMREHISYVSKEYGIVCEEV